MKKLNTSRRRSADKVKSAPRTIAEYIAGIPGSSRKAFTELRAAIQSAVPRDSVEIISYRIPAFRQERVLVWFAAFANHCSLFPTASVIEDLKADLKNFSTSKGTIHFPNDRPIPRTLVKKLVKARVAQAANK
jgi:uncharacterized protein YdhG (YjbR/CyaY superfamily)